MARTFTGLKLQGVVGRFGRTSISDIEGFLQFPDGKVLSGSEWGNMLLWEESLIKLQVTCLYVGRGGGKRVFVKPVAVATAVYVYYFSKHAENM